MRILYIITGLRHGGAEKLLFSTCKYLVRMPEVQVDIVYFDPYSPMIQLFHEIGIRPLLIKRNLALMPRLMSVIRNGNYDVVHSHLIHADLLGRLAALLSTNSKATAIFSTTHGTEWFRWKKTLYCRLIRLADRLLSIPKRSYVIAISQSVREMLIKNQGLPPHKVTILYNAIDPLCDSTMFKGPKHDGMHLLFVGRLAPEKNIPCLIRAMQLIKDLPISLTIVGEGKMKHILDDMIKKMGLNEKIDMPGATLDTHYYYSSHDVLVLPSTSEGLGIVILEAFINRLPVIGSEVEGIKELLQDNRGLLFSSDNHYELAEQIKRLSTDFNLQNTLRDNGYNYVKRHHDIHGYVNKLHSFYRQTCNSLQN